MSKKKVEPWHKPRDVWSDDKLIDQLGAAHRQGGDGNGGRNDHGRKAKDSCMVMLVLMVGGGAATVLGGIAAVKGLS